MKKGDLVIHSDTETFPDYDNLFGIVVDNSWKDDWRVCSVLWAGRSLLSIHYKHELKIVTNEGIEYGEFILAGRQAPKRTSN